MKTLLSVLLLILAPNFAQSQNLDWLITAGGLKSDKATTIVVDDNGFSYVTGYYNEQAQFGSFDTGFSFASSKEVFVAKIDPIGNYVWVRNGINYFDDRGLGLCLDPAGNVFVTGTCWGGLDWGSLSVYNPPGWTDQIFVVKLDPNGNEIWMKNAGNDDGNTGFSVNENGAPQTLYQDDHGQDLASDSQGNIYVTGFLSNIHTASHVATFDAISITLQPEDSIAFLAKLDNGGNWLWVETFQGIHQHRDNAVAVDDDDNVYVTGGFVGTKTFGTSTLTSFGEEDIYVVKYASDGTFQWVTQAGSPDSLADRGDGITYGYDGHMYVTGEFRGKAAFGTDTLNNYGSDLKDRDCFVAKITKDGQWKWAAKAGSSKGSDRGIGICANTSGNIFVSGQFSGSAKFGSAIEISSNGDSVQAFIAGIDSLGSWRWVKAAGGPNFDRAASVDCDENCNVYFTGYYSNSFSFDGSNISTTGGKEIFTGKLTDACFGYSPPPTPTNPEEEEFCEILEFNVFTPNNDEVNDKLVFSSDCNMDGTVLIYNRWGQTVYESNDLLQTWDGRAKSGKIVNAGTYFYKIEVRSKLGEKETKTGFITVII